MVFDVLRLTSVPLVGEPLAVRRSELERLLERRDPCLQLVDQTDEVELAQAWLTLPNVEGWSRSGRIARMSPCAAETG
jgi:hypothetical protein